LPQADTPAEYYFPDAASSSVCGPLAVGGVVDVERVDANERGIVVRDLCAVGADWHRLPDRDWCRVPSVGDLLTERSVKSSLQ
jgi:hypothetical protein